MASRRGTSLSTASLVRARLLAHPVAIGALVLDLLLSFTVIAALAAFSTAWVSDAGRQVVDRAGVAERVMVVNGSYPKQGRPDELLASHLEDRVPSDVALTGWSLGYDLPGSTEARPRLAQLGYVSRLENAATLTAGRFPRTGTGDGAVEVAIPASVAEELKIPVGRTLQLGNRGDKGKHQAVEVVGTYRVTDPGAWEWVGDRVAATGAYWLDLPVDKGQLGGPRRATSPVRRPTCRRRRC